MKKTSTRSALLLAIILGLWGPTHLVAHDELEISVDHESISEEEPCLFSWETWTRLIEALASAEDFVDYAYSEE